MTTIPEDVMQKAEEAYSLAIHDSMAGKADYLRHVALAILAEREGWQHAKTAPADTAVIATDGKNVGEASFIDYGDDVLSGWYWASDRDHMSHKPTHWRPLPKPPVSSANEGATHD
jgi:hypothetical protein